ncbi:hypothetical protein Csa_020748 [Cucumis sativus]|uniref:Uncharacterized protein n=1 Tax=Cucumis sativus TaxID=3659 RepID=A0A0A0KAH0_CUCSA|nr:hypothetical protein Csa_020748 [Cucumis sativus]
MHAPFLYTTPMSTGPLFHIMSISFLMSNSIITNELWSPCNMLISHGQSFVINKVGQSWMILQCATGKLQRILNCLEVLQNHDAICRSVLYITS